MSYPARDVGLRCEDCGQLPEDPHLDDCIYYGWDDSPAEFDEED